MSTRYWPDTLPGVIGPGYSLSPVDQSIRTDMEVGARRLRRISAARADSVAVAWKFTDTEMTGFRAWAGDEPWSLSGDSDDLGAWSLTGASVTADAAIGPAGQLVDHLIEDASAGAHRVRYTLDSVLAGDIVQISATLKAAGRDKARIGLQDRSGALLFSKVNLATGTLSGASGILSSAISKRGNGWWRVTITADAGSGAAAAQTRIQLRNVAGDASYAGDGVSGIAICEINTRLVTGYDLNLPTRANGKVRGAAGGSAWFQVPLAFGGGLKTVEARFEEPFRAQVLSGLGWHVTSRLEVRSA